MEIKDKVVVITGSSQNIGEAIAYAFAKKGAKIVVNCLKSVEKGEKVAEKCKDLGAEAIFIQGDVSKEADMEKLFQKTLEKFGTVDILINNAGAVDSVPFMDAKVSDWVDVFNNNLFGTMLCSQMAAKIMKKNKCGKILNTASIRGIDFAGREGIMAYSAAKAAVINFTKTLAKELAPDIQVNAIAPGFVWTPNYESIDKKTQQEFIDGSLLKRWIKFEEIAEGFVYLAQADAVTAEILTIDAGWTTKS